MAVPEAADPVEQSSSAIAQLLAIAVREALLAITREIFERKVFTERLAYSPDEAAELLGISRELVHDLLRTGQLGSVKAGRRRLISIRHLEAFLAVESTGNRRAPWSTAGRPVPSAPGRPAQSERQVGRRV